MNFYRYFQAHLDYFWQWEEDTQIIAIPNGNTIVYRQLALEILEHLSPQGLPSFGCILLAIIATNSDAETNLNTIGGIARKLFLRKGSSKHDFVQSQLPAAIAFLKTLANVPEKYKQGKGRLLLFQTLFERGHNRLSERKNKFAIHLLKTKRFDKLQLSLLKEIHPQRFHQDFRQFALLNDKFPTVDSILAQLSALPEMDELLELEEIHESDHVYENFVDELIDHTQTFHMGALIPQLWSGLDIPYHHALPSQQPLGGVSDITNKGEYSKLLISEFAHEELIFLSRLANNEALFLNREIPPQSSNVERVILVDASIKSWGTPKTIAHAIMIAIAHHPKTAIHCEAYAVGDAYYPLKFQNINEVIVGLQMLDACLHPSKGLQLYFEAESKHNLQEIIFVGAADTFKQAAFQEVLQTHQQHIRFLIQTDAQGNIAVYRNQKKGKKHIQHIQLPLARLWKKKPTKERNEVLKEEKTSNYPILFPSVSHPKTMLLSTDEKAYQITEKTLLKLDGNASTIRGKGWKLLVEGLPFKGQAEIGILQNGDTILLMFNPQNRALVWINVTTNERQSTTFSDWKSSIRPFFFFYNDTFNYLTADARWIIKADPQLSIHEQVNTAHIREVYNELQEKKLNLKQRSWMDYSILKKVKTVFINQRNNLVFNSHELICTRRGIRLEIKRDQEVKFAARLTAKDEFTFPSGSKLNINRLGLFMLDSNNASGKYLLMLKNVHRQKLHLIKNLRLKTSIPLASIQQLVSQTPSIIASGINHATAEALKQKLLEGEVEAELEIVPYHSNTIYIPSVLERSLGVATNQHFAGSEYFLPSNHQKLTRLSPSDFFEKYIKTFINQATHGVKA